MHLVVLKANKIEMLQSVNTTLYNPFSLINDLEKWDITILSRQRISSLKALAELTKFSTVFCEILSPELLVSLTLLFLLK